MVKKEITVAVIIGLIISALVAGGIYRARQALKNLTPKTATKEPQIASNNQTQQEKKKDLFLTITSPEDNSVVNQNKLQLVGETLPNTYIAIITETSEYLIVPNDLGQFSQEIKLIKGANTIKITVYQPDGTHQEKTLNLVYTTAEI